MAIRHFKDINRKAQTLIEFGLFILRQALDDTV